MRKLKKHSRLQAPGYLASAAKSGEHHKFCPSSLSAENFLYQTPQKESTKPPGSSSLFPLPSFLPQKKQQDQNVSLLFRYTQMNQK